MQLSSILQGDLLTRLMQGAAVGHMRAVSAISEFRRRCVYAIGGVTLGGLGTSGDRWALFYRVEGSLLHRGRRIPYVRLTAKREGPETQQMDTPG